MKAEAMAKATLLNDESSGSGQLSGAFMNVTATGFRVIAPRSGRQYNFARPGEQIQVDPRDRAFLAKMRQLRQLR